MERYMKRTESAGENTPAARKASQYHDKEIWEKSTRASAAVKAAKLMRLTTRPPVWGVLPSMPRRMNVEEREKRKAGTRATVSKGIRNGSSHHRIFQGQGAGHAHPARLFGQAPGGKQTD
jgi:hypothetical protein